MEIILLEDIRGLGARGQRVKVSPGYARNFLIPNKVAIDASGAGANIYVEAERQRAARDTKTRRVASSQAAELEKLNITIAMESGDEDKLFGSVTSADIAEQINAQGHQIDKRRIVLDEPLRQLGVYSVPVKLHSDVEARVKVWVVKK